ncbi:MAG: V-type ATP synthase subunit C [Firmicutes bacterium]|nr:V-type ATP synthase subunit C [Bacillota bacterium]
MKHGQEQYEFPCAVIRGNEKTLLSRTDLIRVIESKQFQSAIGILAEFGYGDGKELESPREFENLLRQEQRRVKELVFSILPEKESLAMLLYPADYHNVKALLKAEFLGIDPSPYLTEAGTVTAEKMSQMIKERNYMFLSLPMKYAVQEAVDLFSKGRDPQEIDIVLDRACYKDMLEAAAETEDDFLIGYVRLLIDILNLTTFVRLRQMGKGWTFFQKVFLVGGTIDERVFTSGYEEPYQQFADRLAPYGMREILADGGAVVKETGKYTLLEKLCDDKKIQYLRDAKYVTAGLEPLLAFYGAKESEIKNLRMVLTGKISGTSEEIMKERLRETYV